MMKIGSMFSGIGGLDLAAERAFDGELAWAVEREPHCAKVLRRHWPMAQVVEGDVQQVDPSKLAPVDVLTGGFPCTDLSVAGKRAGLDGERSGLYSEVLRFAGVLQPEWLVLENVIGILKYRERIEGDLSQLGYGSAWVQRAASDVGAPHWRRRVFIICKRGGEHLGVISKHGRIPGGFWPTALADGDRVAMFKQGGEPLGRAVRWPTATARDWKSGSASDATMQRNSRPLAEVVRWPTPTRAAGTGGQTSRSGKRKGEMLLGGAVKETRWPTAVAGDAKACGSRNTPGSKAHKGVTLTDATRGDGGTGRLGKRRPGRLSADWVETLMGFPIGWTLPEGHNIHAKMGTGSWTKFPSRWPAGRGEEQHGWEPPRLLEGKPVKGRPARLKALGNAVVPKQGFVAIMDGLAAIERAELGEEGVQRELDDFTERQMCLDLGFFERN